MKNYFESFVDEYADEIVSIQPEFYKNAGNHINKALSSLGKKGTVLDIGNGGVINYDFSHLNKLVCADLSVSPKAQKRYEKFENIKFCEANMLDLSQFEDNIFDAVIIQTVIHHLAGKTMRQTEENVSIGLKECFRILKMWGALLIVESKVIRLFEIFEKMCYPLMQLFFYLIRFDTVYQYSAQSLLKKIHKMSFEVEDEKEIELDKYIWLCRKKILTKLTPCKAHWIVIRK